MVSERIREFGAEKPVVGDLVMPKEKPAEEAVAEDAEMSEAVVASGER